MRNFALIVPLMLATPVLADETLFSDGAWELTLITYDDGTLGCSTSTRNGDGTTFYFETWPGGSAAISAYDADWQFPPDGVSETFGLRVNGGEIWVAEGSKFEQTVQAPVDLGSSAFDLLLEMLTNGTSLEVLSAKGTPVTRFTLDGAAATLEYHFECESRFPDG